MNVETTHWGRNCRNAMGLTGGYLEEILDHLEGTGRWWKDRSISQYTLGELGLFWTEGSGDLTNVAN